MVSMDCTNELLSTTVDGQQEYERYVRGGHLLSLFSPYVLTCQAEMPVRMGPICPLYIPTVREHACPTEELSAYVNGGLPQPGTYLQTKDASLTSNNRRLVPSMSEAHHRALFFPGCQSFSPQKNIFSFYLHHLSGEPFPHTKDSTSEPEPYFLTWKAR